MSAHPLIEIHFEFLRDANVSTVIRHLYHVPRIGDSLILVEAGEIFSGVIYEVQWENEIVRIRVR